MKKNYNLRARTVLVVEHGEGTQVLPKFLIFVVLYLNYGLNKRTNDS